MTKDCYTYKMAEYMRRELNKGGKWYRRHSELAKNIKASQTSITAFSHGQDIMFSTAERMYDWMMKGD